MTTTLADTNIHRPTVAIEPHSRYGRAIDS